MVNSQLQTKTGETENGSRMIKLLVKLVLSTIGLVAIILLGYQLAVYIRSRTKRGRNEQKGSNHVEMVEEQFDGPPSNKPNIPTS